MSLVLGLVAILVAGDGEMIDESLIAIQGGTKTHRVRLESTEDWQRCQVVIRAADSSELGRCNVHAGDTMSVAARVFVPPAMELARRNWEEDPQSTVVCDAYLAELLKTPDEGPTRRSRQKEIARLITSQFKAGDLDWWKSTYNEQRLERLLEHFRGLPLAGAPWHGRRL